MLEDRSISVLAYNLATILAEKLETVISRGDQNTRPRDYYDIYILTRLQAGNIEPETLRTAFRATTEKRDTSGIAVRYEEIMQTVRNSEAMNRQWNDYRKDFDYAAGIEFSETCDAVVATMDRLYDCKVSANTLHMMDQAMRNLQEGRVSPAADPDLTLE